MACFYPFVLVRDDPCMHAVPVPCGKCAGCRADKIQMWQDRIQFESLTSKNPSSFVTLTFDEAHMPRNRSADKKHMQGFFKRLRYYRSKHTDEHFRFFYTSEYGNEKFRLHYHAIITNLDGGSSDTVEDIASAWADRYGNRLGIVQVGSVMSGGIRYVTEYMSYENPKLNAVYKSLGLSPLVHGMSKGIGKDWIFLHADEIRKSDGYYSNGILRPIPRYFADKLGMIQKNEYVKRLPEMWQKYNDILKMKGMPQVDPFDVQTLYKNHYLDQLSSGDKRNVFQRLVGQEGKDLYKAGKTLGIMQSDFSPSLGFNTVYLDSYKQQQLA